MVFLNHEININRKPQHMDFFNLDYLQIGTAQQKRIYFLLRSYKVFQILEDFSPLLAGTFPIDIAIEASDLDIILESNNLEQLRQILRFSFENLPQFSLDIISIKNEKILICQFQLEEFPVEIYAKNIATKQQNAYRHLLIEYQILQENDNDFKRNIIALKNSGLKTEPAFAQLLKLDGDPYQALLDYNNL